MKILSIVIVLYVAFLFSCKKTPEHTVGPDCTGRAIQYLSPEISNFKFKKGTYWIFVDSVSLVIDTMRVDSVIINGVIPFQYCPNNFHEYYSFRVNRKNIFTTPDNYSMDLNRLMRNQRSESGDGTIIYEDNFTKTDSLFIYDRYYKGVSVFTKLIDMSENNDKTVYYINNAFGFLKKEVYNSANQLLSKKILKDKLIIR